MIGAPTRHSFDREPIVKRGAGGLGGTTANPEMLFFVPSEGDHYGIGAASDSTNIHLPQGPLDAHLATSGAVNSPVRHLLVQRPGSHVEIVR